jgi:hypothetical protein
MPGLFVVVLPWFAVRAILVAACYTYGGTPDVLKTILRWLASLWTTATSGNLSAEGQAALKRLDTLRADTSWLSQDAWAAKWHPKSRHDRAP